MHTTPDQHRPDQPRELTPEELTGMEAKLAADFKEEYPEGEITVGDFESLPASVQEWMLDRSPGMPERQRQDTLREVPALTVTHENGDKTYAVVDATAARDAEDLPRYVWLVDQNADGEMLGWASINHNAREAEAGDDELNTDRPYVDYTVTTRGHHRHGLAARRVEVMHAMSRLLFDKPLYSSRILHANSKRLWEKLVGQGKAEAYEEDGVTRFVHR
ncbi:MAG: hypothetical protein M3N59_00660 [bacterium]|nr:hypothetical protein [bacterium]